MEGSGIAVYSRVTDGTLEEIATATEPNYICTYFQ